MTTGNKNKLFYWFNIIFLMINTSLVVFLWSNTSQEQPTENTSQELNMEFLREELELTDEQYEQLMEIAKCSKDTKPF